MLPFIVSLALLNLLPEFPHGNPKRVFAQAVASPQRVNPRAEAQDVRDTSAGINAAEWGLRSGDLAAASANSAALEKMLTQMNPIPGLNPGSAGTAIRLPKGDFHLARTLRINRQMILEGTSGWGDIPGTRLIFPDGVSGIVIERYNTSTDGKQGDWTVIRDLSVLARGRSNPNAHGIHMKARAKIVNVKIQGFGGHGIYNFQPGGYDNGNNWHVQTSRITNCGGWGMYIQGLNANVGQAIGVDCSYNLGGGFFDSSFHGNTYIGCHAQTNGPPDASGNSMGTGYAYRIVGAAGGNHFNYTALINCYAESPQPSLIEHPAVIFGGSFGGPLTGSTALAVGPLNSPNASYPEGYVRRTGDVLTGVLGFPTRAFSGTTTIDHNTDLSLFADASGGTATAILPRISIVSVGQLRGKRFYLKKTDASGNVVQFVPASGERINGVEAPYIIGNMRGSWAEVEVHPSGNGWEVIRKGNV